MRARSGDDRKWLTLKFWEDRHRDGLEPTLVLALQAREKHYKDTEHNEGGKTLAQEVM